jgi:hypothetical protein
MDKKLARKNMRSGISMFIVLLCLIGVTFVWAAVFLNAVK